MFNDGAHTRPPPLKHAALIFFLTLGLYTLTAGGHLYSPDEEVLFRVTQSLAERGELAIAPLAGFATKRGTDGKEYAQYGVGQPLLAVPFYWIGKALAPELDDAGWRRLYGISTDRAPETFVHPLTAEEIAPRLACSFFNILVGAATAAVLLLLLRQWGCGAGASFLGAALYAFGSLAWAHSRPFFTESLAVFFMLLAWLAFARAEKGQPAAWMFFAGAAAGFAALVRMDSVLMYPGLGVAMIWPLVAPAAEAHPSAPPPPADPRVSPASLFAFVLPGLACGGVLLGLNAAHFGGPFSTGYSDQPEGVAFSTPILAGLYGFLFSAGKGLFFFSPALIVGLWSWRAFAERAGAAIAVGVLVSILLPLLVMSKWVNWAGGWCWGPRHIVMIHPFLAIPAAFWLAEKWGPLRRGIALGFLAAGAMVQLLGSSQDFMAFHWTYFRNHARQNFRVLYDDFDAAYWAQYYRIETRLPEEDRLREGPELKPPVTAQLEAGLQSIPAPIQHSIYIPQTSVWTGYPRMWRDYRSLDNFWFRMMRGEPAAAPAQPPAP